jgi:hypothetical protein
MVSAKILTPTTIITDKKWQVFYKCLPIFPHLAKGSERLASRALDVDISLCKLDICSAGKLHLEAARMP